MRHRTIGALAAVSAAAALGLSACGGSDAENEANAVENLCSGLAEFSNAVSGLKGLDPESGDFEAQASAVENSWQDVESDAQDVEQADVATLKSAWSALESAIDELPSDTTPAQALQAVQPQITALEGAVQETEGQLDCSAEGGAGTGG